MARDHIVMDASTGVQTVVPYTIEEEAEADSVKAAWDAEQVPIIAEKARKDGFSSDPDFVLLLDRAKTATNAQINTWLASNVTNLAQARTALGALIKIVAQRL